MRNRKRESPATRHQMHLCPDRDNELTIFGHVRLSLARSTKKGERKRPTCHLYEKRQFWKPNERATPAAERPPLRSPLGGESFAHPASACSSTGIRIQSQSTNLDELKREVENKKKKRRWRGVIINLFFLSFPFIRPNDVRIKFPPRCFAVRNCE